jgi:hypothetical protein
MRLRRKTLHQMIHRNRIERIYEQMKNQGKALDEEDYCLYKGYIIHPAHLPSSDLADKNTYVDLNRIAMLRA